MVCANLTYWVPSSCPALLLLFKVAHLPAHWLSRFVAVAVIMTSITTRGKCWFTASTDGLGEFAPIYAPDEGALEGRSSRDMVARGAPAVAPEQNTLSW